MVSIEKLKVEREAYVKGLENKKKKLEYEDFKRNQITLFDEEKEDYKLSSGFFLEGIAEERYEARGSVFSFFERLHKRISTRMIEMISDEKVFALPIDINDPDSYNKYSDAIEDLLTNMQIIENYENSCRIPEIGASWKQTPIKSKDNQLGVSLDKSFDVEIWIKKDDVSSAISPDIDVVDLNLRFLSQQNGYHCYKNFVQVTENDYKETMKTSNTEPFENAHLAILILDGCFDPNERNNLKGIEQKILKDMNT